MLGNRRIRQESWFKGERDTGRALVGRKDRRTQSRRVVKYSKPTCFVQKMDKGSVHTFRIIFEVAYKERKNFGEYASLQGRLTVFDLRKHKFKKIHNFALMCQNKFRSAVTNFTL